MLRGSRRRTSDAAGTHAAKKGPTIRILGFAVAVLLLLPATPIAGQIPANAEQARQLLEQDPERARELLAQSGLTDAEIRARLSAQGLPVGLLDAFLSDPPPDARAELSPSVLSGLEVLGLAVQGADGLELVEPSTGMQEAEELVADSSRIFGHGVFRRGTTRFQPLLSGPVPDEYRIGPGDRLLVLLTGEVEIAHELTATREGFLVVPQVGRVSIANLTMAEVRSLLRDRLSAFYSGIERGTTTVSVSVTGLRTIQVYVVGEVAQAGAYQLASVATATNALYAAGGPTELGTVRDIRVRRRDGTEHTLDLYPYLLEGDVSGDVPLEQGDVVFVPLTQRRVRVTGAVGREASFDLADGDALLDVLAAAGGFGPDADRKRLTVHRIVRPSQRGPGLGDRQAIDLALTPSDDEDVPNYMGGALIPPLPLQDGDSIVVGSVPAVRDGYFVTISGMVAQPDTFPWSEGMSLRDLVRLARGPVVGADLREAEISRLPLEREDGELAELIRVPLDSSYLEPRSADGRFVGIPGVALAPPGSAEEFALSPYDQVLILRQPDFELPQSVQITGEVSVPGHYSLTSKGDRVSDLVDRAQGVLGTGYLAGARLYRASDGLGRIDLNLVAAMASPDSDENVLLQPGDSLHVPQYSPTVTIRGAVNSPVTVLWREGQEFDHYIAAAGGYRSDADEGRASVRFANGLARTRSRFLFWSSYPTPDPGSVITVPTEDPADRIDTVQLTSNLVAILGSVVTLIIVIDRN